MTAPTDRPADLLPIRYVAERTGLSPDVLRVWERRYGVVNPVRSPGGQRWYTANDLARLRLLARAVQAGRSISRVAALDDAALAHVVHTEESARLVRGSEHALVAQPYLGVAIGAVERMDDTTLEVTLRQAALHLSMTELLDGIIVPLICSIGERWVAGTLTPAHEHLASSVIRQLFGWMSEQNTPAAGASTMLVTTPAGHLHEIGALLAAATVAANGWRVVYLGPNLPASDIASAAMTSGARTVALSIVYPTDDPRMDDELRALRAALGADVGILAGGSATAAYRPALDAIGATVVTDLPSLRAWLASQAAP